MGCSSSVPTNDSSKQGTKSDSYAPSVPENVELNFKPIHSAIRWNKPVGDVEKLLVSREAANIVDETNGNRPIHIASQNGHNDLVHLLIKKKADIMAKNAKGNTALHMAVGYDYYETAQILIKAGADVNDVNDAGIAAQFGLEGDKAIGVIALAAAESHADVTNAFVLCEQVLDKLNRVTFIQAGLKAKKALGSQWTPELQTKFKDLTSKIN